MMVKKTLLLILCSPMLVGCFAESLTLVQSGVGASQGRALQSAASPVISLSIKKTTGSFPLEHIMRRERERLAKKATDLEKKVIYSAKKTIEILKTKISPVKKNLQNKVTGLNDNFFKFKTFATKNFKHNPRFSYKVR